jgi:TonB family protein
VPTGFLATTGGTTGGAAALSAVAHVALVLAAVIGVHGADVATSGAHADVDAIAIETPDVPAEAAKAPEIVDDHPQRVARTSRARDVRIDERAAGASTKEAPTAAPVVTATDAPAAHFAMTVNAVEPTGVAGATPSPLRHDDSPQPLASRGAARARVTFHVEPKYTAEALAAGIEGDVGLEIVVSETGAFVSARVTRRLGYGLDEAALAAVARWRFEPYRDVDGRAAAVRMPWPVRFRLQ